MVTLKEKDNMVSYKKYIEINLFISCLIIILSACNSEKGSLVTDDESKPIYIDTFNEVLWEKKYSEFLEDIIVFDEYVILLKDNSSLSIIESSSGNTLWEIEPPNNKLKENIFFYDDALFISHVEKNDKALLIKYNIETGEVLGSTELNNKRSTFSSTSENIIVGDTYYYIDVHYKDDRETFIRSYNLKTGEKLHKIKVNLPDGSFTSYSDLGFSISKDEKKAYLSSKVRHTEEYKYVIIEISMENNEQSIIYSDFIDRPSEKLFLDDNGYLVLLRGNFTLIDILVLELSEPYPIVNEKNDVFTFSSQAYLEDNRLYNPAAPLVNYDYLSDIVIDKVDFLSGNLKFSPGEKYVFGYYDRHLSVYDLELNQMITLIGQDGGFSPDNFDISEDLQYIYAIQNNHDLIAYRLPEFL